jgi:hypothetical protein
MPRPLKKHEPAGAVVVLIRSFGTLLPSLAKGEPNQRRPAKASETSSHSLPQVEQFDTLLPILTVEEMLMYTAQLKRPMWEASIIKRAAVEVRGLPARGKVHLRPFPPFLAVALGACWRSIALWYVLIHACLIHLPWLFTGSDCPAGPSGVPQRQNRYVSGSAATMHAAENVQGVSLQGAEFGI